jgi:hypothetical protein
MPHQERSYNFFRRNLASAPPHRRNKSGSCVPEDRGICLTNHHFWSEIVQIIPAIVAAFFRGEALAFVGRSPKLEGS